MTGSHHVVSPRIYLAVFATLIVGTVLTVAAARVDLGLLNTPIALAIAVTKATLVVLFFMHVKYAPRLTWVVIGGAVVWLMFLLATVTDYYSPTISGTPVPTIARE